MRLVAGRRLFPHGFKGGTMSEAGRPKIHFVALVSVEYDVDLLPYFLPHYDEMDLDNYCLFLHEGPSTDDNLWAEKAAKEFGWKCRFIPREATFGTGELKRVLLNKFQKAAKPSDYILCADGDEIQEWENSPQEVAEKNYDMALGRRFDRFAETLGRIDHTHTLEENFPLEMDNLSKILFPRRQRPRDKIVMAKCSVPVDYKKCASLTVRETRAPRVTGDVKILHYKWRDGVLGRLSQRADYLPEEITAIKSFFEHGKVGVP
jgi:hypothetical protein